MNTTPIPVPRAAILLVEDSLIDIRLTTEALSSGPVPHQLHVVRNGEEALAFLHRTGAYVDAPRPALIFLDLNLPKKNGRDVLAEVKSVDDLRVIPVCVLTSSEDEKEILDIYRLHANCCITKSMDVGQFIHKVQSAKDFWLSVTQLPSAAGD